MPAYRRHRSALVDRVILVAILGVVVVACMLASSAEGRAIHSFAGPFVAYSKRFYNGEPGPDTENFWYIRATHFNPHTPNKPQRLTGNVTLGPHGLSDRMWGTAIIDSRSNNQWKENAFVFKFPASCCTSISINMPEAFRMVFGRKAACPSPQGTYSFRDEPLSSVYPNVPILPYGEYRLRMTSGVVPGRVLGELIVNAVVIPKVLG